ncbi:hypothetical protein PMI14_06903 [Acidovorax sp. CF316]|uniref:hypothetical protein n=1 Tax=Acidovorax sp. CF316 TaxID=1144317 RepID=UPI00026BEAC5|nr:hypothetical protein [Acidovorax sp. CF316]EJE48637.1 hypothetical protein PMI14_06903 [Acidovorax sp. CF316]
MNRINPKALIVGTSLLLALSILAGVVLVSLQGVLLAMEGQSEEQIIQALAELAEDDGYLVWSMVLGALVSVLGGHIAARIAVAYPYFNGLAVGVLGTLVGLAFWSELPLWFNLAGIFVTPACCVLGAHLAVLRAGASAGRMG